VERGGEEARARRWTAGTPAAAIKAGGSVRGRYGRERKGKGLGGVGLVRGALKEKGRRRGEARGRGATAAGAAREVGRRLELEDGPDRWAPPVSGAWEARGIAGRLE
jgi:hypothetical protein